jgi:hypothetical protein
MSFASISIEKILPERLTFTLVFGILFFISGFNDSETILASSDESKLKTKLAVFIKTYFDLMRLATVGLSL